MLTLKSKRALQIMLISIAAPSSLYTVVALGGYRLTYNYTTSVPQGFYLVSPPSELKRETLILFMLPRTYAAKLGSRPWFRPEFPLLKQVAAMSGDKVCFEEEQITINGAVVGRILAADRQGRPLPRPFGCEVLTNHFVLPLATHDSLSLDGRYFGPISTEAIIGTATPLLITGDVSNETAN